MDAIVIIPVYEPEPVLEQLVFELLEEQNQVIIVDDGSSEENQQIFWELAEHAIVLHHSENKGKGAAIKTALTYLKDHLGEYNVIGVMDGDGQHLPKDMERLIFRARQEREALVLGVRQVGEKMPFRSRMGNSITRKIFHIISGVYVSDTQSGLRAFGRNKIEELENIPGDRYEYETAVLYHCAKKKIPIVEVPIDTIYKDNENSTSHFKTVRDSVRIYRELLKFVLSSMSSFMLDYLLFGIFIWCMGKSAPVIAAANILARLISASYNYLVNTKVVFQNKVSSQSVTEYMALATGILLLNNVILNGYVHSLGIPVFAAKLFTELTLFMISFVVQKAFIFKEIQPVKKIESRQQGV